MSDTDNLNAEERLRDESDWHKAELSDTAAGYEYYIKLHQDGKYVVQAQMAIAQMIDRERVTKVLAKNRNAFSPVELQHEVANNVVSWDDLRCVYSAEELEAIKHFRQVTPLPDGDAPDILQRNTTEVYFWGTPSSGKTCALGALLSASFRYGILTKRPCNGRPYMDRLCNIFINDGLCILPQGTPDYSIQEMVFTLRDSGQHEHPLTCIDLAGEVFRALYRRQNRMAEDNYTQEQALKTTLKFLADSHNKKIHFFIVAYGEENKEWDGLRMHDYLESAMDYLRDNNVIRNGTNAVYILVTKCDLMPCRPDERRDYAIKYVQHCMPAFVNSLSRICKASGVQNFDILPFSLGNVFAQKICRFESDNTDQVLNKLILYSKTKSMF